LSLLQRPLRGASDVIIHTYYIRPMFVGVDRTFEAVCLFVHRTQKQMTVVFKLGIVNDLIGYHRSDMVLGLKGQG